MTLLIKNIEYFELEVSDWIADKATDGKTHQDIIDERFDPDDYISRSNK